MHPMVRTIMVAAVAAALAAGCGKKDRDKPAAQQLDMGDATCQDADGCVADCERGVVAACALASSIYTLGYKVQADPDLGNKYRTRYLALRERGCKEQHVPQCDDSAPHGRTPDWKGLRDKCAAGDLNSCLRCKASRFGDDCSRIPQDTSPRSP